MTPVEALEVLRREHTPYIPQIVDVLDDAIDAEWREPTFEEQVESDLWCDGCNRAASRCTVATVLALVDEREEPPDSSWIQMEPLARGLRWWKRSAA
jgi:hypothetical protein